MRGRIFAASAADTKQSAMSPGAAKRDAVEQKRGHGYRGAYEVRRGEPVVDYA